MKHPFSKLVRTFADNLDIRDNSRELYVRILKQFSQWVVRSGLDIRTLVRADILRYKSDLLRDGKSENTIDSYLTVLRMFYEHMEATGEHDNIAAGIRVKHKRKGYRKNHLVVEQINTLLNSIDTSNVCGLRDYALINLLLRTGMRCVEASRLRACDIEPVKDGYYISLQRKGDNDRSERIGATEKAIRPLMDYMCYRGVADDQEHVFVSHGVFESQPITAKGLSVVITKRMKAAKIYSKMITPHSLRHTAAVQALMSGAKAIDVQVMLGHRSVKTTEIYFKSIEDERRLNNPAGKMLDDLF